jgi:hypothetical protein
VVGFRGWFLVVHPVLDAAGAITAALAGVTDVQPVFMSPAEKGEALLELTRAASRLAELRLRILVEGDDLAVTVGARDAGHWVSDQVHLSRAELRADLRLGEGLVRWERVAAAVRDGRVLVSQAKAIVAALDDLVELPDEVSTEITAEHLVQAEAHLVDLAATLDPEELRCAGRRILEVLDPEVFNRTEARLLEFQERAAVEKQRLRMRGLGDGTTRVSMVIPDVTAARLASYLHAYTNPSRTVTEVELADPHPLQKLPYPRRAAEAFVDLMDVIDPGRLPVHGGTATTLIVTIPLDALQEELGTGDLLARAPGECHDRVSAAHARYLACRANILPTVLGGKGQVLDVGRSRRFYTGAALTAMQVRDRHCRAEGCDIPAAWCHAHHLTPWSRGGHTNLNDGVLLCPHHHRRVHDTGYRAERLPSGDLRYHRRR